MEPWLTVVGIGEDGWAGLSAAARQAVSDARVLFGGQRHFDLVGDLPGQERLLWPSPFSQALDQVLARRGTPVCVLASGDPMMYGVGARLARRVPAAEMRVLPALSSLTLAAARLCWSLPDTALLTVHGRPLETVNRHLQDGARLLILAENGGSPARLARLLVDRGFGGSILTVLEHLGGPAERQRQGVAAEWDPAPCADLNVMAVACRADAGAAAYGGLAGLPDSAFVHDGQLTKRDVRAVTLGRLAPLPGQLLWDVGAGSGAVGIEWLRSHPACRALAVEADAARQVMIERNRAALGVPGLVLVAGRAPEALSGLEAPDAVFIGGGVTAPGVADACWAALKPGGRLVANAVTVQGEARLVELWQRWGGELLRIAIAQTAPLGRRDGWRSAMPVTLLSAVKPA